MSSLGLYPAFQQYVRGSFVIEVFGPYHCGPNHISPKHFEYEVTLHYPNDALDKDGFLQDNLDFVQYVDVFFTGLSRTELSCELLARKCAMDLCGLSPSACKGVMAAIWPISNKVKVEYLHTKDEDHTER